MVEIVNMLLSGNLNTELELSTLVSDLETSGASYDPESFPGIVFHTNYGGTVLLFSSGKYTITGVTNIHAAVESEKELYSQLSKLGVSLSNIESADVRNLVCTAEIGHPINHPLLILELGLENTEYEPEQSPFLVYRPEEGNGVMTIASSGRIVITGITEKSEAEEDYELLIDRMAGLY